MGADTAVVAGHQLTAEEEVEKAAKAAAKAERQRKHKDKKDKLVSRKSKSDKADPNEDPEITAARKAAEDAEWEAGKQLDARNDKKGCNGCVVS